MRTPSVRVSVLALLPTLLPAQEPTPLTFADTRQRLEWTGTIPSAIWAHDGVHVELFDGKRRMWFDPKTGKVAPAGERPAPAAAAPVATVLLHEGDLWLDEVAPASGGGEGRRRGRGGRGGVKPSDQAVRLTSDGVAAGRKSEIHLNAARSAATFVRANNLSVIDLVTRDEWQITTDGGPELFHGMLDWVYQEEIYGRGDFQGHWWSPQGDMIAFLSLDESPVKEFTLVDHVPEGFLDEERAVVADVSNYPKAGDPNPFARMSVAHRDGRKVVAVDLAAFPKDVLVARVEWTPDGKTLLLTLQDRIQTWAELCAVDPATGALTKWLREESPTWVNRPESPRWLRDGSFLWMSERTGYQHIYRVAAGGGQVKPITEGEWQVRRIVKLDEAAGTLWFEGSKDGAIDRNLYRVGLDSGELTRITSGAGTHAFELNDDGSFVIDRWSAMNQPPKVQVLDGRTGAVVREVGQTGLGPAADKHGFAPRRRLTIRARDGYELDASLQLPHAWKAGQKYPVFLPTYSGPDAPSVNDSWAPSTQHQFLGQQGFVVLQVNVRSASGRGQAHTGKCYQQLGVQELKDLEDAVDFVCQNHGGDPARVCISGWSYGGFMAAFALTHSKKFALGLAGAGVYDWRLYDTIYTERFMRTPQENKQGYDATSVIKAAKNLHGHLVIVHGTMDDNVHMQNAMQLLWELQTAGKQNFEVMFYPRSTHGLAGEVSPHHREFEWRALQKLLDPAWKPL
ncbi:MAG: S9 family peptidase [Planctomycetes bacterium]|nr:S9 family peptidase [Planctomycetota bacterium]